jgi:hypothetical protein
LGVGEGIAGFSLSLTLAVASFLLFASDMLSLLLSLRILYRVISWVVIACG